MRGKEQYDSVCRKLQSEGDRCIPVIGKMTGHRPPVFQFAAAEAGMQSHQFLY